MSNLACKRCTTGYFMLGGVVAAYVKALQLRVGKQEKDLSEYKLPAAALMDWRPRLFDFRHARFEVRQAHVTASYFTPET